MYTSPLRVCHKWMSHVTYARVTSHRTQQPHIQQPHTQHPHTQPDTWTAALMPRMCTSLHDRVGAESHAAIIHELTHVTQMYESWVMSRICMSHVMYMHESCHIYVWVISLICMRYVTYMDESCHTHVWVRSRITPRHHPRTDSCHTDIWVMSHVTYMY